MELNENRIPQPFADDFELVAANSGVWQQRAYALRYRLYCIENNFEKADDFPDELERDVFDDHSLQCLVIYRPTQVIVSMCRLVLPNDTLQFHSFPLVSDYPHMQHLIQCDYTQLAEISRFMIDRNVLRGTQWIEAPNVSKNLFYMLFQLLRQLVKEKEINYVCGLTDTNFLMVLDQFGIRYENLGGCLEKRGMRQPIVINCSNQVFKL